MKYLRTTALSIRLGEEDLERIEQSVRHAGIVGTRYDENQMRVLNTERV
jgi:hypothetical protein